MTTFTIAWGIFIVLHLFVYRKWAANRIAELEKTVEELKQVEMAARKLIAAAHRKCWEDLGEEIIALADVLGEGF